MGNNIFVKYDSNLGINKDNRKVTKNGFGAILQEIEKSFIKPTTLDALSGVLFTLTHKQTWRFGYRSLAHLEQNLFSSFKSHVIYPLCSKSARLKNDGQRLFIGFGPMGKPFITLTNDLDDGIVLGFVILNDDELDTVKCLTKKDIKYRAHEADMAGEILDAVEGLTNEKMVKTIKHAIDHIDPIVIYTNDSMFTNFATHNNLLGKNSTPREGLLLDDLSAQRKTHIYDDFVIFACCFYLLKQAGFRGEEFNGQQLTLMDLDDYFNRKMTELSDLVKFKVPNMSATLLQKAEYCRALKSQIRDTHFTYRKINGLCFHKSEHYCQRDILSFATDGLPEKIHGPISYMYGVDHNDYPSVDEYFRDVVSKINSVTAMHHIENVLQIIMNACMSEIESDIVMTRGFRDWYKFVECLKNEDYEAISDFSGKDYYCAVFTSAATKAKLMREPGMLSKVLKAISQRMVFNGWHYTPSHFACVNAEGHRHFYFPPRMADTAAWSDQHHSGHSLASVRYTIRSPASLMLNGKKYYGLIDIRLMRSEGIPYSDSELMRAKEYTGYVRSLHQALADACQANNKAYIISQYDKAWYDSLEQRETK